MAVIWIDEFEDGRMESPIGTTLYEHRQIEPTEHALKPGVPYIAQFRFGPVKLPFGVQSEASPQQRPLLWRHLVSISRRNRSLLAPSWLLH